MEAAEELQRAIPAFVRDDLGGDRLSREAAADLCVQL
jgi:hypothetical protein